MTAPFLLTGRHVLVTGASAGIGRATAVVLAGLGARVTATGRDPGRLEETIRLLGEGQGHRAAAFDLGDSDAIPRWFKEEVAAAGVVDGVAHCAGIQVPRPVRQIDGATFDETMRVNTLSAMMLARGLRQKGCHAERASMVVVSSLAARFGPPANVLYAASKGALEATVRGLAAELHRDGIRVNAVAPGTIYTDMTTRFRSKITDEQFEALRASQPLGFGEPEDVATVIAFLLSDAARWVNGVVLPVDGGAQAI